MHCWHACHSVSDDVAQTMPKEAILSRSTATAFLMIVCSNGHSLIGAAGSFVDSTCCHSLPVSRTRENSSFIIQEGCSLPKMLTVPQGAHYQQDLRS